MDDRKYMTFAIEEARKGVTVGQTPFGACIVKDGKVISCSSNSVWSDMDITAHAEINAIRKACSTLKTIDLGGCTIYSTCEPCPMCFSACSWARISRIVFGARIADAAGYGFSELRIPNRKMKVLSRSSVEIVPDFMRGECIMLFEEWSKHPDKKSY
jgi:guanine deaminase